MLKACFDRQQNLEYVKVSLATANNTWHVVTSRSITDIMLTHCVGTINQDSQPIIEYFLQKWLGSMLLPPGGIQCITMGQIDECRRL